MDANASKHMRQAITNTRNIIAELDLSDCDVADLLALMERIELELDAHRPNARTLTICLNSLARSLRTEPRARGVCLELDAVMLEAGIPTNWVH